MGDVPQNAAPHSRVCSWESRRAVEMASLIERQGGVPTIAPSMQEIPLGDNPEALAYGEQLVAGQIPVTIFLTGVGTRALLDVLETRFRRDEIFAAWQRGITVVRGPKPQAVLREWNVRVDHRAPEPNTWREVLGVLEGVNLAGRRVAVQEYGRSNAEFLDALRGRGAEVIAVPVYRWALPDDQGPLREAIRATVEGAFDVILFTSAQQLYHVLEVAEALGIREEWLAAARRTVVGSIGPTATETLVELGLPPDVEPTHPKMGPLVRETVTAAGEILARKRADGRR